MKKMIPLSKQSKARQRVYHAAKRGSWNGVNPVTRSVPNGKAYKRSRFKRETLLNHDLSSARKETE